MKRFLLFGVFSFLLGLSCTTAQAQERATKKDYKQMRKQSEMLDKEVRKKASKQIRKEAKRLRKEGYVTLVGKLPLVKQLEASWEKQVEKDKEGNLYWYVASVQVTGGSVSVASLQATNLAKADLAGQIQTKVTQLIESKVANSELGKNEAATLSQVVATGKSLISATLGRTLPLLEAYRTLPNGNVEMIVTIGYSMQEANQVAIQALSNKLKDESEALARELEKIAM